VGGDDDANPPTFRVANRVLDESASSRRTVVLPTPEGPMMPTTSPGAIASERFSTTVPSA
jgi:hypothetical protein